MRTHSSLLLATLACLAPAPAGTAQDLSPTDVRRSAGDQWQGFRGVGTSHSLATGLPLQWSAESNVAWTAELPGYGQSSPVVWGDRAVVTSVHGPRKELCQVSCFSMQDGHLLWSRSLRSGVDVEWSKMTSKGAPTPVIDAERVYAFFESGHLIALNHDGEMQWHRQLAPEFGGSYQGNHGFGGSLVAADGHLVLLADHDGPSFLALIDRSTGKTVWKTERDSRISWSTPAVDPARGEVVVSSNGSVDGYDLRDGSRRWSVGDIAGNTVPSPTVAGDMILVGASKGHNLALQRTGEGVEVAWRAERARPSGFSSPLVDGDAVFIVNKAGVLFCVSRTTGELQFQQRLAEAPLDIADRRRGSAVLLRQVRQDDGRAPNGGGDRGPRGKRTADRRHGVRRGCGRRRHPGA